MRLIRWVKRKFNKESPDQLKREVEWPIQHVHFLRGIYYQIRIGQIHQILVTVGSTITGFANGISNRISLQHNTIQVIVTLLNTLHHIQGLIQSARQDIILSQQSGILDSEFLF